MVSGAEARLRLLDKADRDILKLDRAVKGAIYDFVHKFRHDPKAPGLQLKRLTGSRLFSARITADYRAILAHVVDREWLLLTVAHRRESYDDLEKYAERYAYAVNAVTGGIEFVDVVAAQDSVHSRKAVTRQVAAQPPLTGRPLFAEVTSDQLRELGVAESLLPLIAKLTTEEELLGLVEYAPQLTGEVLLSLYDGRSVEEVRDAILQPQLPGEPVDTGDFARALARPATQVTTDDAMLEVALEGDFSRWKVFLHPTQRRLVERNLSGPARVSGGPGTGKTVVALHRVAHLARQLPPGQDRPILLTTYTRNLATDLSAKLVELVGPELAGRVDVVNIDRLARRVVDEAGRDHRVVIADARAIAEWRELLSEVGDSPWDAEFLAAEWSQVILGQVLDSFLDYARVRRAGRGHPLTRAERKGVWQLAERFSRRLDERGFTTHAANAARAAHLEAEHAERLAAGEGSASRRGHRYAHVVVDEGQDLHPAHWKMLRAMVAPSRDDLFILADTHQRIYDNVVSLGSLGINIRGRSAKLTLNYRTTKQNLGWAVELLHGQSYDDLDGGLDDLTGYRSILRGTAPVLRGFATEDQELDHITEQVSEWITTGTAADAIAVCVPTRDLAARVTATLAAAKIDATEITPDGTSHPGCVQVGTMHRFKGLEFQRMVIAGVSEGLVPRAAIDRLRTSDPSRYHRELRRDRSLLFVAATRARDDLAVFWHGTPSRFLPLAGTRHRSATGAAAP
jgi:superfamily I DNA/RNA helicase/mRNA-degrading endonuclease RelE of RelBE toxin-antitoxin system